MGNIKMNSYKIK